MGIFDNAESDNLGRRNSENPFVPVEEIPDEGLTPDEIAAKNDEPLEEAK